MDDAGDQHTVRLFIIENDVLRMFMSARAGSKLIGLGSVAKIEKQAFLSFWNPALQPFLKVVI